MALMGRKHIIALGLVILLCGVAIVIPTVLRRPHAPAVNTNTQDTKKGLEITNISQYSQGLDASAIPQIEQAIFDRVATSVKHPAAYYAATVRQGTFNVQFYPYIGTNPPMNIPTTTFVVDIPAAKRTFAVSFSGGTNYPYKILYVLCPSKEQLRYGAFPCQDPQ